MEYQISSKAGVYHGIYKGDTPEDAFLAMLRDAGYDKPEDVTGTVDDWIIKPIE